MISTPTAISENPVQVMAVFTVLTTFVLQMVLQVDCPYALPRTYALPPSKVPPGQSLS